MGRPAEHILPGTYAAGVTFSCTAGIDIVKPIGLDMVLWIGLAGRSARVRTKGQSGVTSGKALMIGCVANRLVLFDWKVEIMTAILEVGETVQLMTMTATRAGPDILGSDQARVLLAE